MKSMQCFYKSTMLLIFTAMLLHTEPANAQSSGLVPNDTIKHIVSDNCRPTADSLSLQPFRTKQLIIPAVLIAYGIIGLESDELKGFNSEISEEVSENIDRKFTVDDFAQYLPAASVYALNAAGIRGKSNSKDRSIILATSYVLVTSAVLPLKKITKVERPDGSSNNSFPSGHTATAFSGAEFLWQEYKHESVWYGISGYLVASGVATFRMLNNKHWLTDVAAGAGIGILSTKAAYWLYPMIKRNIFPNERRTTFITPFYNGSEGGITFVSQF